ncbi:hypothetical protein E5288_WYG011574 [Bos mutus]|uniref:Uncharacterized protein n=1 Tax=Bos mutus TaxID=72004 RepID=A0A6B0RHW2_9CETA|nr:hypothetical protein [Bos mutus]
MGTVDDVSRQVDQLALFGSISSVCAITRRGLATIPFLGARLPCVGGETEDKCRNVCRKHQEQRTAVYQRCP